MEQPLTPNNPAAPGTRSAIAGLVGALLSGVASGGSALAVSCCAGPAIFIAVGLGASGATFFEKLAPYRMIFSFASVGMLMFSFWALYLRKQPLCEGSCETGPSSASRIIFWISVILVASALIVPPALDAFMLNK